MAFIYFKPVIVLISVYSIFACQTSVAVLAEVGPRTWVSCECQVNSNQATVQIAEYKDEEVICDQSTILVDYRQSNLKWTRAYHEIFDVKELTSFQKNQKDQQNLCQKMQDNLEGRTMMFWSRKLRRKLNGGPCNGQAGISETLHVTPPRCDSMITKIVRISPVEEVGSAMGATGRRPFRIEVEQIGEFQVPSPVGVAPLGGAEKLPAPELGAH